MNGRKSIYQDEDTGDWINDDDEQDPRDEFCYEDEIDREETNQE